MSTRQACKTVLLSDQPADSDEFGGHTRVASAIATLIEQEPGGRMIALEGGWGSGKSTVTRLLKSKLESDNNNFVWIFDAWAHEGDPLRRTFLERLIITLRERKWVGSRWDKKREELAKRRRVEDTKNTPQLSPFGLIIALAVFFFPVGSAFLAEGLPNNWALVSVGLVLIFFAPVLFLISAIAIRLFSSKRNGDEKVSTDDVKAALTIFTNTAVTDVHSETIETPEPTSVEFFNIFNDLLGEALKDSKKRAILVIDNLDRVDPKDALRIWATLQTFLDRDENIPPQWSQRRRIP